MNPLFSAEQLRDAFLCGVVSGRLDKSKPTNELDAMQIETTEQKNVEREYGSSWPAELLNAGYADADGKVAQLEHAGWLRKLNAAAQT